MPPSETRAKCCSNLVQATGIDSMSLLQRERGIGTNVRRLVSSAVDGVSMAGSHLSAMTDSPGSIGCFSLKSAHCRYNTKRWFGRRLGAMRMNPRRLPATIPPNDMGPYLSSSVNQRAAPTKKKRSKLLRRLIPVVCGAVVLIVAIVIVAVTLQANSSNSESSPSSGSSGSSTSAPSVSASSCSTVAAQDRTVAFWQSEVAGCDTVPDGVTHVVFGFALVADGEIKPSFQSSDANIKQCVEQLHARCISAMASVGGSTNNQNMSKVANATLFAASAVALVSKFGFAGLDLDDETVGSDFDADRAVAMLKATREALDAAGSTAALLTYDAYFYEGDASVCAAEASAAYSRCFPTGALDYVDWVNIMAYNVNQDNDTAAGIYAAAESTTFAAWGTQLGGNYSLATIGLCVGGGCAYGPGPNATVIAEWEQFARQEGFGGMMIYAASSEVADDFPVTRSIISTA